MPNATSLLVALALAGGAFSPSKAPTVVASQGDKVRVAYIPKKDEVLNYGVTLEFAVAGTTIKSGMDIKQTVTDVKEDGSYVVEEVTTPGATEVNGEEQASDDKETKTTKRTIGPRGKTISTDPEDPESDDPISGVLTRAGNYEPDEDVKVGDEYTPSPSKKQKGESLTFKVDRKEKLADTDVYVVIGKGKVDTGGEIEATYYLTTDRFVMKKSSVKITNLGLDGGISGDLTLTATLKE